MDYQLLLSELLRAAVARQFSDLPADVIREKTIVQPAKNPEHGDLASPVALGLAQVLKRPPLEIARAIIGGIERPQWLASLEAVQPGFINCRLSAATAADSAAAVLRQIVEQGAQYGRNDAGRGKKALVEFVSANPTGPLHVGHCRNAVVGDSVANLLAANGWSVTREYYYNDGGVQMLNLGRSLRARYLQALGDDEPFPEDGYHGEYIAEIAQQLKVESGDSKRGEPIEFFSQYAAQCVIKWIAADLATLGVRFDVYTNESDFYQQGKIDQALSRLKESGMLFEQEGATWLRSTKYGDEKDRVVIKSDGTYTYLLPDVAYHEHKHQRGFGRAINVWGADHKGYVARLKAGMRGLGYGDEFLECLIIQMVAVVRDGDPLKVSKRSGNFITLRELLDEFGPDVLRFFMIMRSYNSQFTFDWNLAQDTSEKNPVFKIQYAHARVCTMLEKAKAAGCAWRGNAEGAAQLLRLEEEQEVIKCLGRFPRVVENAAAEFAPHAIAGYLLELANVFNSYYSRGNLDTTARVIQADKPELTQARLTLAVCLRQVLANALALLGVSAPVKM